MTQFSEGIPPVATFPNDSIQRVVWAHGAIYQNRSNATSLPLVEILLRQINDDDSLSENAKVIKIAVPQLDIVRLGTIWEGQNRTVNLWNNYKGKYQTRRKFTFDFELYPAESIIFSEKYPNTENKYYIPPYIYSLGKIENKADWRRCMNSTFTKLITTNGKTVLIPSLELFTSTFTPEEQQIRNMLIMNPMDEILYKHMNHFEIENNEYHTRFKHRKSRSNLIFLSYLALNKTSRISINKLRSSILLERRDRNTGYLYKDKYPEILPYHPKELRIISDGIWIDEDTFLVLRINKYSLPTEYPIRATIPSEESSGKKYDGDNTIKKSPSRNELEKGSNIPIVDNENSHIEAGTFRIHSQVEYIEDDKLDFECEIDTKIYDPNAKVSYGDKNQKVDALSSGETNSQASSEGTATIEIEEISAEDTEESIKNSLGIKDTIDALNELIEDKTSTLIRVEYLNKNTMLHEDPIMCSFVGVKNKYYSSWMYLEKEVRDKTIVQEKSRPRGCIIAKLTLNNDKVAYLLEIEKKHSDESFSGLIFNTVDSNLNSKTIERLLSAILKHRGKYMKYEDTGKKDKKGKKIRKRISLNINVSKKLTYVHKTIQDSFTKKMGNVIIESEAKEIFS